MLDRAERHAFWSRFLLFILLFFFPLFWGGKRKGEKNNQSRGQKTCLSARSLCLFFTYIYYYCTYTTYTYINVYFLSFFVLFFFVLFLRSSRKALFFDHDFGYSFPPFSSLLIKEGRRKGEWITKVVVKNNAFLLDLFLSKTTELNLLISVHEEVCIELSFIYYLLHFRPCAKQNTQVLSY